MILGTSGVIWGNLGTFWSDFRMANHSPKCFTLHISRSYPLDCYDYWSTSGANKQPRYILRQKKQNRYGGEKEGEGKEIKYF